MTTPNPGESGFEGYNRFWQRDHNDDEYGSFEVYWSPKSPEQDRGEDNDDVLPEGWYWRACSPGCLPDGEPNGPFPTSEGAYLDAIGD